MFTSMESVVMLEVKLEAEIYFLLLKNKVVASGIHYGKKNLHVIIDIFLPLINVII